MIDVVYSLLVCKVRYGNYECSHEDYYHCSVCNNCCEKYRRPVPEQLPR